MIKVLFWDPVQRFSPHSEKWWFDHASSWKILNATNEGSRTRPTYDNKIWETLEVPLSKIISPNVYESSLLYNYFS